MRGSSPTPEPAATPAWSPTLGSRNSTPAWTTTRAAKAKCSAPAGSSSSSPAARSRRPDPGSAALLHDDHAGAVVAAAGVLAEPRLELLEARVVGLNANRLFDQLAAAIEVAAGVGV